MDPQELKEYFGIHSTRSLIRLIQAALATKVEVADIVDDLATDDAAKVLSARQGKVIADLIASLGIGTDGTVENANKLGGHDASEFVLLENLGDIDLNFAEITDEEVQAMWDAVRVTVDSSTE